MSLAEALSDLVSTLERLAYDLLRTIFRRFWPNSDAVNTFCKLLKTQGFISQKSLDTPVFRLLRFRQKVLTESIASVGTILP